MRLVDEFQWGAYRMKIESIPDRDHADPHRFPLRMRALPVLALSTTMLGIPSWADAAEQLSQAAAQYSQIALEGFKLQRKDFRF